MSKSSTSQSRTSRKLQEQAAAYRRLAAQLASELDTGHTSALVVSCNDPELAARTSIVLGCHAAEELGGGVLLIDACKHGRESTILLGGDGMAGYSDLLGDDGLELEKTVHPTSFEGLSFVPAGLRASKKRPGSGQRSIATLLRQLEAVHRLVLVSGGSVLGGSVAASVASHAGCTLLAVVEDKTRLADLEAAQRSLAMSSPRRAGIVAVTRVRVGSAPFISG